MKRLAILGLMLLGACTPKTDPGPKGDLAWAYPASETTIWAPPTGSGPFTAPGSRLSVSKAQLSDDQNPVDWFPDAHPAPPAIVAHSPGNGLTPCAECHGYQGEGSVNTPGLAGLPADYIIAQIHAFRAGDRQSAQTDRGATLEMASVAKKLSDADLKQAAAYFASLPHVANHRVVETSDVPVTKADKYGWLYVAPGGGREPIGNRVIEVSEDLPNAFLDDHRIGFIDYAPVGAVARGQALVASGGPGGQPCATCHGADLNGVGAVPGLAGRAPPYLARMLWDIKTGARKAPGVLPMQAVTKDLTPAQIVDITAYLASKKP